LLPAAAWRLLSPSVQRRFDRIFTPGYTICFAGRTLEARMSRLGWLLAQIARLVGAPLPLFADVGPVAVAVTDHAGNGGQHWCRIYHRHRGAAQVIQSVKRFRGPTGLEEYLGCGISMALRVDVVAGELRFRSAGFALNLGQLRLSLPRWLSPGELSITHAEQAADAFEFELSLRHAWFGELVYQRMYFNELRNESS
jgi:hypothetical protein